MPTVLKEEGIGNGCKGSKTNLHNQVSFIRDRLLFSPF